MVTITLDKEEILTDIRDRSRKEVAGLESAEQRYRVEAGTDKNEMLFRDIVTVAGRLAKNVRRFLYNHYDTQAEDYLSFSGTLVYEFNLSERRMTNIAQPLADLMHAYIVDYALARFYASVSMTELSNSHSTKAMDDSDAITELLYEKQPPIL